MKTTSIASITFYLAIFCFSIGYSQTNAPLNDMIQNVLCNASSDRRMIYGDFHQFEYILMSIELGFEEDFEKHRDYKDVFRDHPELSKLMKDKYLQIVCPNMQYAGSDDLGVLTRMMLAGNVELIGRIVSPDAFGLDINMNIANPDERLIDVLGSHYTMLDFTTAFLKNLSSLVFTKTQTIFVQKVHYAIKGSYLSK